MREREREREEENEGKGKREREGLCVHYFLFICWLYIIYRDKSTHTLPALSSIPPLIKDLPQWHLHSNSIYCSIL